MPTELIILKGVWEIMVRHLRDAITPTLSMHEIRDRTLICSEQILPLSTKKYNKKITSFRLCVTFLLTFF